MDIHFLYEVDDEMKAEINNGKFPATPTSFDKGREIFSLATPGTAFENVLAPKR